MHWPGVCIVEMKLPSQEGNLSDYRGKALEYWHSSNDPPFVVLCAFKSFEVWERERLPIGPHADFRLDKLPDNYKELGFLARRDWASRESLFLKLAAVVIALAVFILGIFLLWGVWDGPPVAAAFTRVGGATRVETALEASRFWRTPPQLVVETQADASQQIMLGAAQCAMAHDAPLLFTSPDPQRQQLVNATINDWRKVETTHPELVTIQNQRDPWPAIETTLPELTTFQDLPEVITIQHPDDVSRCVPKGHLADIAGLSTLKVPKSPIPLPQVRPRHALASVVVFVAAIEPGDPPDVAVGLALAAHMARANPAGVSLVVVPHYLESDPELEEKLQSQHKLVTGGIVLGQTPTVPEDTRVLLRQLISSRDQHGVLGQLQDDLGSAGSLIAALLVLVGLGAAARIAGPMRIEQLQREERTGRVERVMDGKGEWKKMFENRRGSERETQVPYQQSDWIIALKGHREVTVWLRSGTRVTGVLEEQFPRDARDASVFRVNNAQASPEETDTTRVSRKTSFLVPAQDIVLIELNNVEPAETNTKSA